MASEADRKKAVKTAADAEAERFAVWVDIQEDAGYTVEGDSFRNAVVAELPDGPTYHDTPGS